MTWFNVVKTKDTNNSENNLFANENCREDADMNDLQIIRLENTDISGWDFSMLRAELQRGLDDYAGVVYTDETIKDAKNDRSTLNKVKKVIEDARKSYKARCLAPYDALEPQIKELVNMVEKQRILIDETVKNFENRQKEENGRLVLFRCLIGFNRVSSMTGMTG